MAPKLAAKATLSTPRRWLWMKLRPMYRRIGHRAASLCTLPGRLRVATVYGSFGEDRESEIAAGVLREGWDALRLASRFPSASISEPVAADELDFDSLAETDFLLVVTSSRLGFPPPNFTSFSHNLLLAAKSNPGCLAHLQHAVFGNGHPKWYATYMSMPRYVDQLLEEAGSRRFYARGEANEPHILNWPSNHPASKMRVDTSTPAVSVEDWSLPMWSALAAAAEGLEEPPVAWDALWAKEASHKHHEVTAWDELELVTRCGDFEGALSKFAKRPPLRAPPLKSSARTEPILPEPLNTESVPER